MINWRYYENDYEKDIIMTLMANYSNIDKNTYLLGNIFQFLVQDLSAYIHCEPSCHYIHCSHSYSHTWAQLYCLGKPLKNHALSCIWSCLHGLENFPFAHFLNFSLPQSLTSQIFSPIFHLPNCSFPEPSHPKSLTSPIAHSPKPSLPKCLTS